MWSIGIVEIQGEHTIEEELELVKEEFKLKRLQHTEYELTWEQKEILKRYGTRMQALMDGALIPVHSKGKHFVDMCNGFVEPVDKYESAWKSYLLTLEKEKRLRQLHQSNLNGSNQHTSTLPKQNDPTESQMRKCFACKGSGMAADGSGCDKCSSRGWIEAD
jgi:uncharacterized protein YifE (UPF0438 family)